VKSRLDVKRLGTMVRVKRGNRSLRDLAAELGRVSASTLSRVERGKVPDVETFLLLCDWLEVPPATFIGSGEVEQPLDTPARIALVLRSDPKLEPTLADALATLIKRAYPDFCRRDVCR